MGVAQLADRAGRDPSTVSRQLAKLEELWLVRRPKAQSDLRVREAAITKAGERVVEAITTARHKLLGKLLEDWSAQERQIFPQLLQRLADAMNQAMSAAEP